jgi:hypothetical protein
LVPPQVAGDDQASASAGALLAAPAGEGERMAPPELENRRKPTSRSDFVNRLATVPARPVKVQRWREG